MSASRAINWFAAVCSHRLPHLGLGLGWADAHHIWHWADGGPTNLNNLDLLCGHHHDLIHHTPWTVTITNGRPVFTPPPHTTPRTHVNGVMHRRRLSP